jgi:hypothetical protein
VYVAPPPFFFFSVPLLQLSLTYYKLPESCTSVNISPMPSLGEWDVGKSPTQTHIHGSRSLNNPPLQQAQFSAFPLKAYFQQDLIAGFVSFININIVLCGQFGMV